MKVDKGGEIIVQLLHKWQLLRARSQVQKFICISLVDKKLNLLISMFLQLWYMQGMKRVGEEDLLAFYETGAFLIIFNTDLPLKNCCFP